MSASYETISYPDGDTVFYFDFGVEPDADKGSQESDANSGDASSTASAESEQKSN